jgi:hypothetical protein
MRGKMKKYTPGPWMRRTTYKTIKGIKTPCLELVDLEEEPIMSIQSFRPGNRIADLRLVQAAPDLLETCEEVSAIWKNHFEDLPDTVEGATFKRLQQAINKALGR